MDSKAGQEIHCQNRLAADQKRLSRNQALLKFSNR